MRYRVPSPEQQIKSLEQDLIALEAGLCPYCRPTITPIKINRRTEKGFAFSCPKHGTCGRNTSDLVLCFNGGNNAV